MTIIITQTVLQDALKGETQPVLYFCLKCLKYIHGTVIHHCFPRRRLIKIKPVSNQAIEAYQCQQS